MEAVIEALRARDQLVHHGGSGSDPVPRHGKLVEAVRGRDPEAAEAAMRSLLDQAARDVRRALRERRAAQADGNGGPS